VLKLREEAAAADPNDQRAADSVASALVKVGMALRKAGDLVNSERELRRAIDRLQDLVKRGWTRPFDLAMAYDDLADTLETGCRQQHRDAACLSAPAAEVHKELAILEQLRAEGRLLKADEHAVSEAQQRENSLRRGAQ
jgi:hypothetical protein